MFHENCIQSFFHISHKIIQSFLLKEIGEKRIKSINPIQKYPHITESYACIIKIFVTTTDLSINILIFFGMS